MRRFVVSAFVVLTATAAFAQETQRYIVATKRVGSRGDAIRNRDVAPEIAGVRPRGYQAFENVDAFAADLTPSEVEALKRAPEVRYVEAVVERRAFANEPIRNYLGQTVPWGLDSVRARDAWAAGVRGTDVNVVVIDTGIDYNHPDLKAIYAGGLNTFTGKNDPMDDNHHGTHVAGTIAAADDTQGVVGIAPNVRLWAVKVLNKDGTGTSDKVLRAVDWTIEKKKELGGRWVINLSLGSEKSSPTEEAMFQKAMSAGIVVVAASGNESKPDLPAAVAFPGGYAGVVTVGAIDKTNAIATFSNQGPEMDFVAPGVGVLSSVPLGFGSKSYIDLGGKAQFAAAVTGSAKGDFTGEYVVCGFGKPDEIPASVAGKIALIRRGGDIGGVALTFAVKARNAKEKGAKAVIIYNRPDATDFNWSLPSPATPVPVEDRWTLTYAFPLTVGITYEQGQELVQQGGGTLSLGTGPDDYDVLSGTSMASPHVAGAIAMLWSLAPNASGEQIVTSLITTARDLGTTGIDKVFGYGLIDIFSAGKLLAPHLFGSPLQPSKKPTTGRPIGRRG